MRIYIADNRKYATTGNNFNWLIFWGWKARRGELCQALFNTEGLILRLELARKFGNFGGGGGGEGDRLKTTFSSAIGGFVGNLNVLSEM